MTTPDLRPKIYVAQKRGCPQCNRIAELMETSPNGISWYRCPAGHDTFVDITTIAPKGGELR